MGSGFNDRFPLPRAIFLILAALILAAGTVALWSRITAVRVRLGDVQPMLSQAGGIYRVLAISRSGFPRGGDGLDDPTCISASTGSPNARSLKAGQSVTLGWL